MDRGWLAAQLAAGNSYEAIAREVDRHPSTVSYWARRHGLCSAHTPRHAARGAVDRGALAALVDAGLSTRAIAAHVGRSQTTVRHWLRAYGLRTQVSCRPAEDAWETTRVCVVHGATTFVRYGAGDAFRCLLCRCRRVSDHRRRVKRILIAEAGGRCRICGYDRSPSALHFHHVDPAEKAFGLALRGLARSLERCRAEARKCVLLCANCHAEVEAGLARLPFPGECARTPDSSGIAQDVVHGPG
jgi:transposase